MKEACKGSHEEVILQVEARCPPRSSCAFLSSTIYSFFPDSSTRAVVSPARLSRMLTVIRSRIISVIIVQPDAGSVAYILSMYNQ